MVQWLRLCTRNAGGPSSIPGQGIRSHMLQLSLLMPQLKIPCATTKTTVFFLITSIHSYDLPTALLDIDPREMKTCVHTELPPRLFIAASYVIAPNWKQPKCLSVRKWWDKLLFMHTKERYSLSNKQNWTIDTGNSSGGSQRFYSEWRRQSQKVTCCVIPFI